MSVCFWGHYRCVALRCAGLSLLLDTPAVLRYFAICSVVVVVPARVVRCWREARRLILQTSTLILSKFASEQISTLNGPRNDACRTHSVPSRRSSCLRLFPAFSPLPEPAAASQPIPVQRATSAFGKLKFLVPGWPIEYIFNRYPPTAQSPPRANVFCSISYSPALQATNT